MIALILTVVLLEPLPLPNIPPWAWTYPDQWDNTHEFMWPYNLDPYQREDVMPSDPVDQSEPVYPAGPVATPPPDNSGMGNNVEQWRPLVAAYFPADQVDRALRVMACESGGNPNAYNPSGASGLMQVLASWADNFGYTPADLFDPAINLHVASILYFDGGWGHWVCQG